MLVRMINRKASEGSVLSRSRSKTFKSNTLLPAVTIVEQQRPRDPAIHLIPTSSELARQHATVRYDLITLIECIF